MINLSPYFTPEEFRCHCGKCDGMPQDSFLAKLMLMRSEAGFPFKINSAYRCPAYNAVVSHTGTDGPHTMGLAADIAVFGDQAWQIVVLAKKYGMTGVGISQKDTMRSRFVHVDAVPQSVDFPRPFMWSY